MSRPLSNDNLTMRQQRFVDAITDPTNPKTFGNGTQSAIKAGYRGTSSSIRVAACKLVTNGNVQDAIAKRLSKIMSAEEVLEELSTIGKAKPSKKGAIRTHDKIKCLELLGKFHRLFVDRLEWTPSEEFQAICASVNAFGALPEVLLPPGDDNDDAVDAEFEDVRGPESDDSDDD